MTKVPKHYDDASNKDTTIEPPPDQKPIEPDSKPPSQEVVDALTTIVLALCDVQGRHGWTLEALGIAAPQFEMLKASVAKKPAVKEASGDDGAPAAKEEVPAHK
jgi:hypothetical protein